MVRRSSVSRSLMVRSSDGGGGRCCERTDSLRCIMKRVAFSSSDISRHLITKSHVFLALAVCCIGSLTNFASGIFQSGSPHSRKAGGEAADQGGGFTSLNFHPADPVQRFSSRFLQSCDQRLHPFRHGSGGQSDGRNVERIPSNLRGEICASVAAS